MDLSNSYDRNTFNLVLSFLRQLVNNINPSQGRIHITILGYGDRTRVYLNSFQSFEASDRNSVLSVISNIGLNDVTNNQNQLYLALEEASRIFGTARSNNRVILIIAGSSAPFDRPRAFAAANTLKQNGIGICVLTIRLDQENIRFYQQVSSTSSSRNVLLRVTSFNQLQEASILSGTQTIIVDTLAVLPPSGALYCFPTPDGTICYCLTTGGNSINSSRCIDVNECESNNGGCDQICTNREGGFECTCQPGYQRHRDDPNQCTDINECNNPRVCESTGGTCINVRGTFHCISVLISGQSNQPGQLTGGEVVGGLSATTNASVIAAISFSSINMLILIAVAIRCIRKHRSQNDKGEKLGLPLPGAFGKKNGSTWRSVRSFSSGISSQTLDDDMSSTAS